MEKEDKKDNLIEDFIEYLSIERRLSNNTVDGYKLDLNMFKKYTHKDLKEVTADDIRKYLGYLRKHEKPVTINRHLTSIKQFYKYLTFLKIIDDNFTLEFKSLKTPKKLPNYLSVDEVNELLNIDLITSLDYRNKAMLELLYASGMRISELVNLEASNIDFENAIVKTITKGNKERIIPIGSYALEYLNLYINEHRRNLKAKKKMQSPKLFLNFRGEGISRNGFNLILNDLKNNTGITKTITPHILRHSFATHLIEAGADIRVVQELMGHENIETTEIYTHLSNRYVKDSYSESHPRNHKEETNV